MTVRTPRQTPELDLQRQIAGPGGLAAIFGWDHVHFRPALTKHGWRTPGSGTLAAGWPDLTMIRTRDRRLIFAELKADNGKLSPEQTSVIDRLLQLEWTPSDRLSLGDDIGSTIEVYVWRPRDLDDIARILR